MRLTISYHVELEKNATGSVNNDSVNQEEKHEKYPFWNQLHSNLSIDTISEALHHDGDSPQFSESNSPRHS